MAGQATVTQPGGYIQTECKLRNIGHQNITISISHLITMRCSSCPSLGTAALVTAAPAVSSRGGRGTEADIAVGKLDSEFEVPGRPGIVFFKTTLD